MVKRQELARGGPLRTPSNYSIEKGVLGLVVLIACVKEDALDRRTSSSSPWQRCRTGSLWSLLSVVTEAEGSRGLACTCTRGMPLLLSWTVWPSPRALAVDRPVIPLTCTPAPAAAPWTELAHRTAGRHWRTGPPAGWPCGRCRRKSTATGCWLREGSWQKVVTVCR